MKKGMRVIAAVLVLALVLTGMTLAVGNPLNQRVVSAQKRTTSVQVLYEAAKDVRVLKDVKYQETEGNNCYLDVAYRDDGNAKPLLLCVHGGSWIEGDKDEMRAFLYTFSALGYTTVTVNYDLLDPNSAVYGECTSIMDEEACVAVAAKYLANHAAEYQIDPERVILLGHSAGGQLAGRLAERIADHPGDYNFQLKGVVLMAPASDFRYYLYNNIRTSGINLPVVRLSFIFDGVYGTDVIPEINKVDVLHNVTGALPPVLIVQGTEDAKVPVTMSQNLFDALDELGVTTELTLLQGARHDILNTDVAFAEINRFLGKYISTAKESKS